MALGAPTARPRVLTGLFGHLSLRARLLLGLILLAACGLFASAWVVYDEISTYLNSQVDTQLALTENSIERYFEFPRPGPVQVEVGLFAYLIGPGNNVLESITSPDAAPPNLPANLYAETTSAPNNELYFDAGSHGSVSYRIVSYVPQLSNGPEIIVIAQPLTALNDTLSRLLLIDVAASAAVLILLGCLGYGVVRVGLRPLAEIEATAGAIAAGDLSRRVERVDETTEVGRLGASLNAMLGQIEEAFTQQRASESRLRQFLADASHELRTPVTSIRGYAELFRRGAAQRPEDLALAMRRIEDESARMGLLVDDLLLLARLDQGRPLDHEPVDLAAIATDAAADAQVVAPDRTVTVDAGRPVVVDGDAQRLSQVVANLLQNALRYTPAGSPIEVAVHAEGAAAVLSVRDHGSGIAPEHAARIFERFYRADPSRTRESGGVGLGLSIVNSIAVAHGGGARLENAPDGGACFLVELPLAAAAPPGAPVGGPGDGPSTGASERGLLEVGGVVEAPDEPVLAGDHQNRDRGVVAADEGERS